MDWLQEAYYVSQIVLAIVQCLLVGVALCAAYIAYIQFSTGRLFGILRFTQDQAFRDSRQIVQEISQLAGTDWWCQERLEVAASTCCANYDILGHVLKFSRSKRVACFFAECWSDSIIRTFDALEPFIEERARRGGNPHIGYRWLMDQARHFRSEPGDLFPSNAGETHLPPRAAQPPRRKRRISKAANI